MKNKLSIIVILLMAISVIVWGIRFLSGEDNWICKNGEWIKHGNPNSSMPTSSCEGVLTDNKIEYRNTQYGFSFLLPINWKGYSIVIDAWEGNLVDTQTNQKFDGPKILIRHPLWTSQNPRQDIPIMIFTLSEWSLIQQEKLSVSAAPIGPSKLGRNKKYVFALPARYNYAFPTGFEEVTTILENNPLHAF